MNETEIDRIVTEIARKHLHVRTLEEQRSDAADFHDLHVTSIKEALLAACKAGQESHG